MSAWREKSASEFWGLVFREQGAPTHVRVPNTEGLGIFIVGNAGDLHGPTGVCTCCRRAAS
jgi:hypothetical protein